ncbi:MAG: gliding motility-associated C-terminal domain-containing protein [Saprospiraceae bacterium]
MRNKFKNTPAFRKLKSLSFYLKFLLLINIVAYSFSISCFAQNNSFQVVLDSLNFNMQDIAVNEDGKSILLMRKYPNTVATGCYLIPVKENGGMVEGIEISFLPLYIIRSLYRKDRVVFIAYGVPYLINNLIQEGRSIIFNYDLASNTTWSKYLNGRFRQNKCSLDKNGNTYIANTPHDNFHKIWYDSLTSVLELFKLDETGNMLWKKGLLLQDSFLTEFPTVLILDMDLDEDANIYVLGLCGSLSDPDNPLTPYIIKFDSTGHPLLLKTVIVEDQYFNEIEITSTGVMLLSHAPNNPTLYNSKVYHDKYAKLIKLDHDLNFIWGKKYSGENFPYYSTGIKEKPNGNLLMTHSTFGAFPAVVTEMDTEGNILTQKGYPNYEPQIAALNDGSFLMTSRLNYNAAGETFYQPVIAKTDSNGDIEGCETYATCIMAEDYTVGFGTFYYDTVSIPDLEDFDTIVQPVEFSFSEGCNFPPAPVPNFLFPDTLCLADSARTTDTHNRLANAFEWHLSGPGVDSMNTDSFDFAFRFSVAGEYNLKHTVWVLGCAYEAEKTITVLPELEINITPETICPDGPQELSVFSARILREYIWADGSTNQMLLIDTAGVYSVQASDGFCTASDTLAVIFLEDIIGNSNPIETPADTTVCEINLPYFLKIKSVFSEVYFVNNDSVFNGEYILNKSGAYLISTEIDGCYFSKTFNLKTSECVPQIFFPNIFSPNSDGINDEFFPQGNDFEIVFLKVFDRWGGLRYDGAGINAKWSPGKEVAEGAYVYLLKYKNVLTGETAQASGEVVLVR